MRIRLAKPQHPVPATRSVHARGLHGGPTPGLLQRWHTQDKASEEAPPIVHEVLRSPGHPLDAQTRAFFEPRFGQDFSRVRVHTDTRAAESARAVAASAYTVGAHIAFGKGTYEPGTLRGKELMAHELAHVVQQGPNPGPHSGSLAIGNAHDRFEREASAVAQASSGPPGPPGLAGPAAVLVQRSTQPVVMRANALPFSSTMEICRRVLNSRSFDVNDGGLVVTASAGWEASDDWAGESPPECGNPVYNMELMQEGIILDSGYGNCEFEMNRPVTRIWSELPSDTYHLSIWTNNTNPNCCMRGTIEVSQQSGLSGNTCTRPPPGPIDILHDALALAGMIPALGAIPDAVDAGIYAIEGRWAEAGLSAIAIIPIFGDAASLGRIGARTIVRIEGEAVQRLGSEAIANGLRHEAQVGRRVAADVDEAVEIAFAEGRVTSGELLQLQGHATASRARQTRGASGRAVESAHGAPQAAMRGVSGYDPEAALTRLLPRAVHREMDRFWQQEARRLVREGRTTWTAQEMYEAVSQSIRRTSGLTEGEKLSHIARVADEIFVESALRPSDLVRLPFS